MDSKSFKLLIEENHKGYGKNFNKIKTGYTFSALLEIMQADVPIILVSEAVSIAEIELLKQIRDNVCIISINRAWKKLLEYEIIPNFIMGEDFGVYDSRLDAVVMITNADSNDVFMEQHQGKQFFYWSKNSLSRYICVEAQKKSEAIYKYNVIEDFLEPQDIIERAVKIAENLKSTTIILMGIDKRKIDNIDDSKLIWINHMDEEFVRQIKSMCKVKCRVQETLDLLLPIMDENGQREFDRVVAELAEKMRETISYIGRNLILYRQLNEMAIKGEVYKDELQALVENINIYTKKIDENVASKYIIAISEELKRKESGKDSGAAEYINEISQVALESIEMAEKIKAIYGFFEAALCEANLKVNCRSFKNQGNKRHKDILIVQGESQYNVLPNFAEGLKKGFRKLDFNVYLWDVHTIKKWGYNVYQNLIGYDYILLMNGVTLDVGIYDYAIEELRLWYDNSRTRTAAIFVDHPQRHADRLKYIRSGVEIFYVDKYWCKYMDRYMQQLSTPKYLQMGGVRQREGIEFQNREDKIVFFGGTNDLEKLSEEINQSMNRNLIWEAIEELKQKPNNTVEEILVQIGSKKNCLYSVELFILNNNILLCIEEYIRTYFRKKVIFEIAKSGIPMDVYGMKDFELEKFENVKLKEKVDFTRMLEICRKTKFVLNVQAWTKDGIQERVFNTMLAGAVSVTDVSDSIKRQFADEENILLYHLDEIELLPQKISYYMAHSDQAAQIAQKGYQIASEHHTWENRAEEMIKLWNE